MRTNAKVLFPVTLGIMALMTASCSSKSSSKAAATAPATVTNTTTGTTTDPNAVLTAEEAVVTLATQRLSLAGSITILPPKSGSTGLLGEEFTGFGLVGEDHSTRLRVQNDAFQALDQVGSIICFIAQTRFWEQAGAGPYKAFIDDAKCNNNSGGGGGGGGSGGGGGGGSSNDSSASSKTQSLTLAYVEASREEGKPLIAYFRVAPSSGDESPTWHDGKVVVAAPPSEENPAGVFSLYYTGYVNNDENLVKEKGYIRTKASASGKVVLESFSDGGNGGIEMSAELQRETGSSEFIGAVNSHMSGGDPGRGSISNSLFKNFACAPTGS